jgi:homoserine kinase
VAAFASGRLDLLTAATDDRLHEPYRASIYPELPMLIAAARRAGALGACMSGAGSSIIAFADSEALAGEVAAALEAGARSAGLAGHSVVVRPRARGAFVVD